MKPVSPVAELLETGFKNVAVIMKPVSRSVKGKRQRIELMWSEHRKADTLLLAICYPSKQKEYQMRNIQRSTVCTLCTIIAVFSVGCAGVQVDESTIVGPRPIRENPTGFGFPVGYEAFHEDESINYLLNRIYSLGYAPLDDMVRAGGQISDMQSVRPVMTNFALEAAQEERHLSAAFYYRAAEFYTPWDDPGKLTLYERFVDHFYQGSVSEDLETADIPYGDGVLSVLRIPHMTMEQKGTIILHAGYDSFKEELYSVMAYLANYGYDVINFDVPWMGRARTAETEGFSHEWERIVGAVLDHYALDSVTIFGISYGGWLALRAAAFEPRITRVIASSVSFDVNQYEGLLGQMIARFALSRMRRFANEQILKQMESEPQSKWFFDHLMHVTNKQTPIEAADVLAETNEENLHSELVTQDVLILTGRDDHLVPFKMHNMQVRALVNAASVTPKIFTSDVQGQNHCQIGNFGLALDIVLEWLER
jgi:pimeloyl-ACP methyl ester carboxylesterase